MKRFCALTYRPGISKHSFPPKRHNISFIYDMNQMRNMLQIYKPVMALFSLAMLLKPFTRVLSSSPAPELAIPLSGDQMLEMIFLLHFHTWSDLSKPARQARADGFSRQTSGNRFPASPSCLHTPALAKVKFIGWLWCIGIYSNK